MLPTHGPVRLFARGSVAKRRAHCPNYRGGCQPIADLRHGPQSGHGPADSIAIIQDPTGIQAFVATIPAINFQDTLMYTKRETATILAALLFWREEICPHGPRIQRPYFRAVRLPQVKPLSAGEIIKLSKRLRARLAK